MKTQTLKIGQKAQQTVKGVCIVALSLCLNNNLLSQNQSPKFGVEATSSISGAGLGTIYAPGLYYKANDCKIELCLNIQNRKFNISGIQVNFEYTLFDDSKGCYNASLAGDLELFVFSTIKYNANAFLSNSQIKREQKVSPDKNLPLENLKFSVVEGYVGTGLKVKLSERVKWSNSIGFGGWKTLKGEQNLYRDYNGVSIGLNTSLSMDF